MNNMNIMPKSIRLERGENEVAIVFVLGDKDEADAVANFLAGQIQNNYLNIVVGVDLDLPE